MRVTTVDAFCRVNPELSPDLVPEDVKRILAAFGELTSEGKRALSPSEQEAILEDARGTARKKIGRPRGSKNKPVETDPPADTAKGDE